MREAERWAKKSPDAAVRTPNLPDPNVAAAEDRLRILLGTKVEIVGGDAPRGQIRIHFFSQEDLARIFGIITDTKRRNEGGAR